MKSLWRWPGAAVGTVKVEGLELPDPGLASLVVPLSAVILAALFVVQARGTQRIGSLFGPVMVGWFVVIGVAGARSIWLHPEVVVALSPTYAVAFMGGHPDLAFVSVGAVVLAVTGAEALYARNCGVSSVFWFKGQIGSGNGTMEVPPGVAKNSRGTHVGTKNSKHRLHRDQKSCL